MARTRHAVDPILLTVAIAPGLGGSMRSLATVLNGLQGLCRVVACPPRTTFTEFLEQGNLYEELIELPEEGRSRLHARVRAAGTIAAWSWKHRHRLVAFHANGLAERNLVTLAAVLTRVPIIVWMHEWSVSSWARRLAPLLRFLAPDTRFAAVSEQARDTLVEAGLADRSEIEVVPNPIDPADVLSRARPSHDRLSVSYLGTPARYKGFHLLPEIIRSLRSEPIKWLIYAGPKTMLPAVWDDLESISGVDIEIPGKVADVRQAYGQIDIVVCPSLEESFGRVAAEAMCNGLPVVASDIPALRALIGQDQAGLLVPAGDVEATAEAVRRLITNDGLRHRLGQAGRLRAAQFEPGPIVAALTSLYGARR